MVLTLRTKQLMTSSLSTGVMVIPTAIAWGTGSTAFTENSSALNSECERNTISSTDLQSQTIEFTGTLATTEAVGSTIYEVGLFNTASSVAFILDTMYPLNKTSSIEFDTIFIMRNK